MFWGLIMEPDRRYTQIVKKPFRITQAALDITVPHNKPCQVMCGYDGKNYLLCTLRKPDLLQCPLDIEFAADTYVSFAGNGNAHIHLTGYLLDSPSSEAPSSETPTLDQKGSVEGLQIISAPQTDQSKRRLKKEDSDTRPLKKAKLLNGSFEDEESDDEDFEQLQESGNEESSDDESGGEEEEDNEEEEDDIEEEEAEKVKVEVKKDVKKKSSKKQQKNAKGNDEQKADKVQKIIPRKINFPKGVIIEDLVEGNGPIAKPGRYLSVYYEGRLNKSKKVFDSTKGGSGFLFRLGAGQVIEGWEIGVSGMRAGGTRRITCPPNVAYGDKGSPPIIPPNATLVFTVDLKRVGI